MEYSPPPLFKQGASARVKVIVFTLIAIGLLMVEARMRSLTMIRQAVGMALYPLQVSALLPRDAMYAVSDYFSSVSTLQKENRALRNKQVANAQALQQGQELMADNAQLRKLLGAAERVSVKSIMSEILYVTRDAFTRKIVIDRGTRHGVARGQPVIDDVGVVGQVTRVFPFTSEVTLLTDKNQAIPVQVVRSGVRSVAYGRGQSNVRDLRFMPTNTDIRKGDVLATSGIDVIYPPGLSVATVAHVENKSSDSFARIVCQPTAGIDRNKQLLILLAEMKLPPRPEPEEPADGKKDKTKKRPTSKEAGKDSANAGGKPGPEAKPEAKPESKPAQSLPPAAAELMPAAVKSQPAAKAGPAAPAAAADKRAGAATGSGTNYAPPSMSPAVKPGPAAAAGQTQQKPAPKAALRPESTKSPKGNAIE